LGRDAMTGSSASVSTEANGFAAGMRASVPILVPISFFGMMFGAAAIAAGQTLANTIWASIAIFAGASQFVFLEVYRAGVPVWSVALAVFAVNFRHLLYSAALASKVRHYGPLQKFFAFFLLTDLQFAVVENQALRLGKSGRVSFAFYIGFGAIAYVVWIVMTAIGGLFGSLIENPRTFGLDFILPVYFATILMGFRKRDRFLAIAIASTVVAVLVHRTIGAPWHISLGALAGIAVAALMAKNGEVETEGAAEEAALESTSGKVDRS